MFEDLPALSYDNLRDGVGLLTTDLLSRVGERRTVRPRVLNFLVNDICNAECTMCNIWQQMPKRTLSPDEFAEVLSDPLFEELDYVGVSGGEPTLRHDLPEVYEAIVETRPDIQTGIITNALVPDVVIDRVERSARACAEHGVPFNVMVSLDGVGEVHDTVRGTEGAFENAMRVIEYFRDETEFPVSVGCTVTKENVWDVHELKAFCESEGLDYKFRVAEFIDRLYNEDRGESIRNFTDREIYHLGLFFAELEADTPVYAARHRTYRNVRRMLLEGADRTIGCYMQTHGATLDSTGQLMYCAPKSPMLGDATEESPTDLYMDNTDVRDQIIDDHCADCIHDYPSPQITTELTYLPKETFWRERLTIEPTLAEYKARSAIGDAFEREPRRSASDPLDSVMVFGWYGTETAGDKAILGEILHDVRASHPEAEVTLASSNPYYSRWTLQELDYPDVEVIPTHSREFLKRAAAVDEVVMGGGPLMHIRALGIVLAAFMRARAAGTRTRIAGCGIGPLDEGRKYREGVEAILELADVVELRSSADVRHARELGRTDAVNAGDPAFDFVHRWAETADLDTVETEPRLNLYLRDWPVNYRGDISVAEYERMKAAFESELGQFVRATCEERGLTPRLVPMHHFHIGDDDRKFAIRFADTHLDGLEPVVEKRPLTVWEVLRSMMEAESLVCMRYHSVAFASELGRDFYAIDYSRGGKVQRYLEDVGKADRMLKIPDIADGRWPGSERVGAPSP